MPDAGDAEHSYTVPDGCRHGLRSAVLVGNCKEYEEKTKQTYGIKIVAGFICGANDPQSDPVHREKPERRSE
jgi:hypothetical protein